MWRIKIFLLIVIFISENLYSQDYTKISKPVSVKQAILKKHQTTSTLTGNFTEEVYSNLFKTPNESEGQFFYKKSDKVRWENRTQKQTILLDGKTIKMIDKGKQVSDPITNKIVKKVQGMMLEMFSGNFLNEKDFSIVYYENRSSYKLLLTSKNARMSKYIERIELIFNKQTLLLREMTLYEKNDQKIIYSFSDVTSNVLINDHKFNQF